MYVKTHYYYYSHFKHEENGVPSIKKLLSPLELDSSATSRRSQTSAFSGFTLSPRINTSRRWVALTVDLITLDEPLAAWNRLRILCELFGGLWWKAVRYEHSVMVKTSEGLSYVYPDLADLMFRTVFLEHAGGVCLCQRMFLYRFSRVRGEHRPCCARQGGSCLLCGPPRGVGTQFSADAYKHFVHYTALPAHACGHHGQTDMRDVHASL